MIVPSFRLGLGGRGEVFADFPLSYSTLELSFGGSANSQDKIGIGDFSAGAKYLLFQESARWPEMVVSASFLAPTGEKPDATGISNGAGHWAIKGGFEFVRTYDPVVLFWGMDYTHQFESHHFYFDGIHKVRPGGAIGYNFGLGFAINQNISVSSQLVGRYAFDDSVDGTTFGGSSREPISLRLAVTSRWSKNTYIEPSVAFGLNNDAPDVNLTFSITHGF
jgi:hypothetical protein